MLNNDGDKFEKRGEGDPLGNISHNSTNNLPPQELKTMKALRANFFAPLSVVQGSEMGDLSDLLDIDRFQLSDAISTANRAMAKWRESDRSFDKLNEIIRQFTGEFNKLVIDVTNAINNKKQELEDEKIKEWQNPCFDYDTDDDDKIEDLEFKIQQAEATLQSLIYKFEFYVPGEEGVSHTNLGAFIEAINDPSDEVSKLSNKLDKEYNKGKKASYDLIEELQAKLLIPEEKLNSYTSISTFFLHAAICTLDHYRAVFLQRLTEQPYKKEDIINALAEDCDYIESPLANLTSQPTYSFEVNGQDLILTWEVPALFSKKSNDKKEILEEFITPIKDILKRYSADLSLEVNRYEIIMTISCPKQKRPENPICESMSDAEFYSRLRSSLLLLPKIFIPAIFISNGDNSFFELELENKLLRKPTDRKSITNVLSYAEQLKKPVSLIRLNDLDSVHIFLDEKETTLQIPSSILTQENEEHLTKLSEIIESDRCASLTIRSGSSSRFTRTFQEVAKIIDRAIKSDSGRLATTVFFGGKRTPHIIIQNQDHEVICDAIYLPKRNNFAGRFCSSALINEVVDVYNSIIEEQKANKTKSELYEFMYNRFSNELRRRGIYPTESFVTFHKRAVFLYNDDTKEPVSSAIKDGKGAIWKWPDGRIILDYYTPQSQQEEKEYYMRNIFNFGPML